MKRIWTIAIILISLIGVYVAVNIIDSGKQASSEPATLQLLDTAQLTQMIRNKEEMVIVDVREPELYAKGRVPTAINIPFDTIKQQYSSLPKDKKIVFVCHVGRMGKESGELLLQNGYREVYNLEGGMAKWSGELEQ